MQPWNCKWGVLMSCATSMLDLCPLVKNLVGIYGSKKVGFMVFIVLCYPHG
jgi:hypothetical protein